VASPLVLAVVVAATDTAVVVVAAKPPCKWQYSRGVACRTSSVTLHQAVYEAGDRWLVMPGDDSAFGCHVGLCCSCVSRVDVATALGG